MTLPPDPTDPAAAAHPADAAGRPRRAGPADRVEPGAAVLALDLGATRLRAAVVQADGTILARAEVPTPGREGPDAVIGAAIATLREVRDRAAGGSPRHLVGVGLSAPGPVDPRRGTLVEPPNIGPGFRDVPFAGPIGDALGLPARLERDTHVAALAEHRFGAARGVHDFLYLTVSSGFGGAIVIGDRLYGGPDGVAGELGHLVVELDGPLCACGARGHIEAICSGTGMARLATAAALEGSSPALAALVAERSPGLLEGRDVAVAAEAGDPAAAEILDRARRTFAAFVVGLVDVFAPERIVVGGGIAIAEGERLLGPARDAVARHGFRIPARRVEIVPAALGADVGLVGAVPLLGLDSGAARAD